jgi:hypothetical protein
LSDAAPLAHQFGVVGGVAGGRTVAADVTAEELAGAFREALGEEHPDRDAIPGDRVVISGGVSDQKDPTIGDGADALMKVRRAERARYQFRVANGGDAAPCSARVISCRHRRSRAAREHRHQQHARSDGCLVPLVATGDRHGDGFDISGIDAPVTRQPVTPAWLR